MKRRTFFQHVGHSLAIPGVITSFGFSPERLSRFLKIAEDSDKVLVLIYLQGGNDGLNTVVPLDQLSALNKVRPHVILPENKILKLDQSVGLHPSLSGMKVLFNEGRLKIIQSVGYSDQNYSHFRSTDIWMSGSDATTLVNSGWAGRYLNHDYSDFPQGYPNATTPDPLAVELGYGSSMLFQGPAANMSMVISDPTSFYQLVDNLEEPAPDTDAGAKLKYIRLTSRQSQLYGQVVKTAAAKVSQQKGYDDNNPLAQQLKVVARLIAGGLRTSLYLVRLGNFDTHNAQVETSDHTKGAHSTLLMQLDRAITSFMIDLKAHNADDRVLGMTFSEFGRRITSNSSAGTDHGSASPLFVFGNNVKGGVLGSNPQIANNATNENNLSSQFDFKQIYGSVLEQWFGVADTDRQQILLNTFDTVPIIRDGLVTGFQERPEEETFTVYPNPLRDDTIIEFVSSGIPVKIVAIDMKGQQAANIYAGTPPAGKYSIQWNAGALSSGRYFILLRNENARQVRSVVKI
jgi:uncharacterized protein (DUF1501 family)